MGQFLQSDYDDDTGSELLPDSGGELISSVPSFWRDQEPGVRRNTNKLESLLAEGDLNIAQIIEAAVKEDIHPTNELDQIATIVGTKSLQNAYWLVLLTMRKDGESLEAQKQFLISSLSVWGQSERNNRNNPNRPDRIGVDGDHNIQITNWDESTGVLSFSIQSTSGHPARQEVPKQLDLPSSLSIGDEVKTVEETGASLFAKLMILYGDKIKVIKAVWQNTADAGDNYRTYSDLERQGLSNKEAAFGTFTGKMAAKFGFRTVYVKSSSSPQVTEVNAFFSKVEKNAWNAAMSEHVEAQGGGFGGGYD